MLTLTTLTIAAAGLTLGWILGWFHGRAIADAEDAMPDTTWRAERLRRILGDDPVIAEPRITAPLDEPPGPRHPRWRGHAVPYDEVDHRHV